MKVVFSSQSVYQHPFEVVSWHYVDRFPPYLPKVTVEVKAIASRFFRKSLIAKYAWALYELVIPIIFTRSVKRQLPV
jgi:hypothetical protein